MKEEGDKLGETKRRKNTVSHVFPPVQNLDLVIHTPRKAEGRPRTRRKLYFEMTGQSSRKVG